MPTAFRFFSVTAMQYITWFMSQNLSKQRDYAVVYLESYFKKMYSLWLPEVVDVQQVIYAFSRTARI